MTPADLHKLYAALIGLILLVGGFFWFRASERHAGAIAVLTQQVEAKIDTATKQVAQTAQKAALDSMHQQAALSAAKQQLARSTALQRTTDSIAHSASEERDRARIALADTAATVGTLRDELRRLVAVGGADSVANATQHGTDQRTIGSLLVVIAADSTALASERSHSAALQALADLRLRENQLLKGQAPSFIAQHLGVGPGYVCTKQGCDVGAAVIVRVLP